MKTMKHAFAGIAILALLAATACAGQTGTQVAQSIVTDAQTLASGLNAELPAIEAIPGVNAATVTAIKTALADINTEAAALSTSLTTTSAQPIVTQIETNLNTVLAATATIPGLPASVQTAIDAAQVVLPVIEVALNMVVPVGAAPNAMTPDQALAILKAA